MQQKDIQLCSFGLLFVIALICVLLSGVFYSSYWGLFVLIPYFLLPLVAGALAAMSEGSEVSMWKNYGYFFESFFWVVTIALPAIMLRVDVINTGQFLLLLAASVFVFIAYIGFAYVQSL